MPKPGQKARSELAGLPRPSSLPEAKRRLAFARAVAALDEIQELAKQAFPDKEVKAPSKIEKITEGQLEAIKEMILRGVTAKVAACQVLSIHPTTYDDWMEKGRSPQTPELVCREFYLAIREAALLARGVAESIVYAEDPLSWLRGPGGRGEEEPGWGDERLVKHADHTGKGPARVQLEFTPRGLEPRKEAASKLLEEGSDDADED